MPAPIGSETWTNTIVAFGSPAARRGRRRRLREQHIGLQGDKLFASPGDALAASAAERIVDMEIPPLSPAAPFEP